MPVMTARRRLAVLAACIVVAALLAWYGATRFTPSDAPPPDVGSVRLGPEPGDDVTSYLAKLPAQLPPPGVRTLALVQFGNELTAPEALAAVGGSEIDEAVLRVPLTRVQTALRFEPLEPGVAQATALDTARQRAQMQATADAGRLAGRPRDVAAAEAAALSEPGCRCTLALVVRSDRAGLQAVAARSGVRAVEAAPPDATIRELALAPLLPEQTEHVDPPPDDGPVPPA
jgi:hypothetical protein